MSLWLIGFAAAAVVVVLVALLLIGILVEARRIRTLAGAASQLVLEIDENTRIVWALRDTDAVAASLLEGAKAIDGDAAAIVAAVSRHEEQSAA